MVVSLWGGLEEKPDKRSRFLVPLSLCPFGGLKWVGLPAQVPKGLEKARPFPRGKIHLSTKLADTHLEMPPRQDAEKVDDRDADTPDAWVKRHKDCVASFSLRMFWEMCRSQTFVGGCRAV